MQCLFKWQQSAYLVRHYAKKVTEMKYLNVAEKHDAAKTIAGLLSNGTARRREGYSVYNKVFDFETQVRGQNSKMTMTSVSGHLMQLEFLVSYRNWRTVDPKSLFDAPLRKTVGEDYQGIKRTLEREIRGCQGLIIWTDCDREGENIGFEIIDVCRAIKPKLTVYRANFSEITTAAVRRALQQLGEPDKLQSDAVDVRTELDLRTGAAITRFQTMRLQRLFPEKIADKLISYGSCQIPTLGFVAERYKEIEAFVSEAFWKIRVTHTIDDLTVEFNWARNRLFDKQAVEDYLLLCLERPEPRATVENVTVKPKHKWRPTPMDTVEMEKLGSRKLKLSAKETMTIAEKLYTKGIISYPRTETNQFSKEFELGPLVEQQTGHQNWGEFAQRVLDWGPNPRNGNKSDQAHPPIHPTKLVTNLEGNEARVYELVVRHFLACVSRDAVGSETIVNIDIAGEKFNASGLVIHERNYLDVYVYDKWNAKQIHHYEIGQKFEPTEIALHEGATTAPPLLTEADLIALMEKHGIGTDATHAEHINTIKERGYIGVVDKGALVPGVIGMGLYEGYDAMELALAKPLLRAEFEADLKLICQGRKNPQSVLTDQIRKYKEAYQQITDKITAMDDKIAQRINETPSAAAAAGSTSSADGQGGGGAVEIVQELHQCPKCDVAPLALKPKKNLTGHFIGCLNFPDCRNVVWLPDECKEYQVLSETCTRCGDAFKLLKFKFSTAYYKTLFNAPFGWYKTCLRCDSQFRNTFDINLDSVKRVGGIVADAPPRGGQPTAPPTQPRAKKAATQSTTTRQPKTTTTTTRQPTTTTARQPTTTTTTTTTRQPTTTTTRQPKTTTTTTRQPTTTTTTTNNGSIRNYFTPPSNSLDDFFDSNDAFEEELLAAVDVVESTAVAAGLTDDIAAAFAADDDSDFEALVNGNNNAPPPPPPPSPPPPRVAVDLNNSVSSWVREARDNEEAQQTIAWGTRGLSATTPVPVTAPSPSISNRATTTTDWTREAAQAEQAISWGGTPPVRTNSSSSTTDDLDISWGTKGGSRAAPPTPMHPAAKRVCTTNSSTTNSSTTTTGSSWSRSERENKGQVVRCSGCHQPARLQTARRDGPNQGRDFYKCPKPKECKFFQWADEEASNTRPASSSNSNWGASNTSTSTWGASNTSSNWGSSGGNSSSSNWGSSAGSSSTNYGSSRGNTRMNSGSSTVTITKPPAPPGGQLKCNCGKAAISLIVRREGPNQGRPFFGCQMQDKKCGFFKWGDTDENNSPTMTTTSNARTPNNTTSSSSFAWGTSQQSTQSTTQPSRAARGAASGGVGGRARRCGLCRQEGHTRNTCPRKNEHEY